MMQEHHYLTQRTARYYTLGSITEHTAEIWIVVHGYAELASEFIKHFEPFVSPHRFFIAPEGLSRFYAKGFGGKPAASWMTSEDRLHEIRDYVHYIDSLVKLLIPENYQGRVNALGFSQGVATVTRWLNFSDVKVSELVIYAGQVAAELAEPIAEKLLQCKVTYITGDNDPLLKVDRKEKVEHLMHTLNATRIVFEGGHVVKKQALDQYFNKD